MVDLQAHDIVRHTRTPGYFTVEGIDALMACLRMYSGMRRPEGDDVFVACIGHSRLFSRVMQQQAQTLQVDEDDLTQFATSVMWQVVCKGSFEVRGEAALVGYLRRICSRFKAGWDRQNDALTHMVDLSEGVDLGEDDDRLTWLVDLHLQDQGLAVDPSSEVDPDSLSKFVQASKARWAGKGGLPAASAQAQAEQDEFDALLAAVPDAKTRSKRGRPSKAESQPLKLNAGQQALYDHWVKTGLKQVDFAHWIGVSPAMLNKHFSGVSDVPPELLATASAVAQRFHQHADQVKNLFSLGLNEAIQRWEIQLAGRPMSKQEIADILEVSVNTVRKYTSASAKGTNYSPPVRTLARYEQRMREHFAARGADRAVL